MSSLALVDVLDDLDPFTLIQRILLQEVKVILKLFGDVPLPGDGRSVLCRAVRAVFQACVPACRGNFQMESDCVWADSVSEIVLGLLWDRFGTCFG